MGFLHVGMKVDDVERATRADDLVLDGLRLVSEYRSEQVDFAFFAGDDLGGELAQLVHFKQPRHEDAVLPGYRTKDGGRS